MSGKKQQGYSKEIVESETLKYFDGDELAAKVFIDKYALRDKDGVYYEKTPDDMHHRLAKEFARIEKNKFQSPLSEEEIYTYFKDFKYIVPQGSPMFGIGNDFQIISLSNCFLLENPIDSYSSILETDQQLVNISKRRGGCGIDLSHLRPEFAETTNAARTSSGIVTWMERYSNSIREVGQNGRRGALLLSLSIHHPDIMRFCTVKNDPTKVTGANISVRLTREFMDAVKEDRDYELRFPVDAKKPIISKMVKAKEVWKTIIHSAWLRAEPGLLMWDNVIENTPTDCYKDYQSKGTNPCSEIILSELDSCRLMALNLYSYINNPFTESASFDFELFGRDAQITQRLMDDLVDLESEKISSIIAKVQSDPEPDSIKNKELEMWQKIKRYNDEGRRTGTGITALGDTLAALGLKYGSDESIDMVKAIYQTLKLNCYRSSVDMAKELGSFKDFDWNLEKDCPFLKRIASEDNVLYADMKKYGRRNIALLTTAPTGSLSIMTKTSSGIEPIFMLSYIRRKKINKQDENVPVDYVDDNGDQWQEFQVYHPKVKEWMRITGETDITKSPWYGSCAEDIDWIKRVEIQSEAQKHVCHSISSTVNLPEDVTEDVIAKIYETAFAGGCKGITVYRSNCRSGVLVDKKNITNTNSIIKTSASKRKDRLLGDVHHLSIKGEKYYVVVGMLHKDPYEVFTGLNSDENKEPIIPKRVKGGSILKKSRGTYLLESEDEETFKLTNGHTDDTVDALTRMISISLRHGVDISFIVHQLEKTKGDMMCYSKALARTLKKYIADGTTVSGESCHDCGGNLVRQSGCVSCLACGWSKCQ